MMMVFDPRTPQIDISDLQQEDWEITVYREYKELIHDNFIETRGIGFIMSTYIDSDGADKTISIRLRTRCIVHLNYAHISWPSTG